MWKLLFVIVCLLCRGIYANPMFPMITEFQTSPDSLERIELNFWMWEEVTVVTRAGIAYVDTSLVDEYMPVIDSTNTTGEFGLDDECDTVLIINSWNGWVDTLTLIYPDLCPGPLPGPVPAPPPGASASYFYYQWGLGDWYIDTTPTFGAENDGYPYCIISGGVFDQDSVPLVMAEVSAVHGMGSVRLDMTNADGLYSFTDMLPGPFTLIATKAGYSTDSINIFTYALCPAEGVNFYLSIVGIEEEENFQFPISNFQLKVYPNPFREKTVIGYRLSVTGEDEKLITDYHSPVTISIYDLAGRLIRTFHHPCPVSMSGQRTTDTNYEITWDGTNNSGKKVKSGVYFIHLNQVAQASSLWENRARMAVPPKKKVILIR